MRGVMRVLVVDHDAERRDMVSLCVRMCGHTTGEAGTTEAALEALALQSYDLLIIDPPTRGLDALNVIRAVRARWPDPRRPAVVVFSGDRDPASRAALVDAGAVEVIAEPLRIGLVREVLARCGERA